MKALALLIAAIMVLLSGCVYVANEPALDFPERPSIVWSVRDGRTCIDEEDADAFSKWIDKLNEFEAARQRLLRGCPAGYC
jgi:hypothetical protein